MFFSVLIPVYKTAQYLEECFESVIRQTFIDYEVLFLLDGSSDTCDSICDEFANHYPFVRVLHKSNEGLMMTRRRGFKESRGEYLICLDSDDYLIDCNTFEKIHDLIVSNGCDLVLFDYYHGAEKKQQDRLVRLFDHHSGYVFDDKQEIYERLLTTNEMNNIWLKCPKRSIVDIETDYSVWQNEICRAEDLFQSYPIINNANVVGYIAQPFYYYRWAENSISNKCKFEYYNAFRRIYLKEDEYLKQWVIPRDVEEIAMCGRVTAVFTIIVKCYFKYKKDDDIDNWKRFLLEISEDTFFVHLLDRCSSQKVSQYYIVMYKLIMRKKIRGVVLLIEMVSFTSRLKHYIKRVVGE